MSTGTKRDETLTITPKLDVQRRLTDLREWLKEWEAEDKRLSDFVDSLNLQNKIEAQKAAQVKTLRTNNRILLAQKPFEIVSEEIVEYRYAKLEQHLQSQFANLSRKSRILWLQNLLFIMLPELRKLYEKFNRIRRYSSLGQQRNSLLAGPSGMGKTLCIDWLVFNNRPVVEQTRNRITVIKVDAPVSNTSPKPILQQMVLGCGNSYRSRDTESDLRNLVIGLFQQCRVEVIVIDEIQHLKTHKMKRHLLEISNDNRGIPMICASCNPIEFTHGDPEIAGRWNDYFGLKPYTGKDLAQLLAFIQLILPFTGDSKLGDYTLSDGSDGPAKFIEQATKGITRDIMILLTDASMLALERGEPCLTLDLLRESWVRIQEQVNDDVLKVLRLTPAND